jgi:hypothetical protein
MKGHEAEETLFPNELQYKIKTEKSGLIICFFETTGFKSLLSPMLIMSANLYRYCSYVNSLTLK